jgi:hypothetical protein
VPPTHAPMNYRDRRRANLAIVVTVVAIPALWFASRDESNASAPASGASQPPPTSVYQPKTPVFIDSRPPAVPPAAVDVLVPSKPTGQQAEGRANYRRFDADDICSTLLAPAQTKLTVYNVDNGREVTCTNIGDVLMPAATDIVIDTDLFSKLSDLADAPITVRISW